MNSTVMLGIGLVGLLGAYLLWRSLRSRRAAPPPDSGERQAEVAVEEPAVVLPVEEQITPPQQMAEPESFAADKEGEEEYSEEPPPSSVAETVAEPFPEEKQIVVPEEPVPPEELLEEDEQVAAPALEGEDGQELEAAPEEAEAAAPHFEVSSTEDETPPVAVSPEELPEPAAEPAMPEEAEVVAEEPSTPEAVEDVSAEPVPDPPAEEAEQETREEAPPVEPAVDDDSVPLAVEDAEPPKAEDELERRVILTLELYAERLNAREEQQRYLLEGALRQRDEKQRDQLQRELVIMNDKLALLADSYHEDLVAYQQALDNLDFFEGEVDDRELGTAREQLQAGDPEAAEKLYTLISGRPSLFAARAAFQSGQLAECRVDLEKALDLYRLAVEKEPDNPRYVQAAAKVARSLYFYRDAQSWQERYVRLLREQPSTSPVDLALALRDLAYTLVLSGQYQKAGPLYKESMTLLAKQLGQDHPEMGVSWYQIGELQETLGEYDKAVGLYRKALEIVENKRGKEHPSLASILDRLAALCMELEIEKQAIPLYERLVHIREKALRPTHPQLAMSLNNLAESYRLQGQYAEAEACYQKSLVINEMVHGKEHPAVAAVLQELAKLCTSQRKAEEARLYQERAAAIFKKSVEESESRAQSEALTLEI